MAENKTKATEQNVIDFINAVPDAQKRDDSFELIKLMEELTSSPAKMWGPSIVGFGEYHYKYASGHEGDAPLLGFSPRKAAISLYISIGNEEQLDLINKLGKFKMGKACIYVKKLKDIDLSVAKAIALDSMRIVKEKYG
ncbi:MAG: DUF1801 domain-containing protein [Flavobacterium sp.]|nr:MAG: DUF1801 domain-containing protein [Flavobacterium sp.]